jgi:hypothetical protein
VATVLDLPTLETLRDEQRALRAQLARLRGRLRLQLALEFAADMAIVLTATAALLVLLDWWFRFSLPVRLVLLSLSLVGVFGFLGVRAWKRWRSSRMDELSLAMTLDRYRPGTGQRIADVLQLPDLLSDPRESASPAMVRLAVGQASAALAGSDWGSLWNRRRTFVHTGVLLLGVLIPMMFAGFAPDPARLSVARWLFGSSERWPQQTYLTVMGLDDSGRLVVPRDERFMMEVRSDLPIVEAQAGRFVVHGRGESLTLKSRPSNPRTPESIAVQERTAEGPSRGGVMVATESARFQYEFPPSPSSSTFKLEGGDDWLGPLTLERVDRPSLAETRLRVKEPGATYEGFRSVDHARQHLIFLPDTEIELTLVGNEALSDTKLKVHTGSSPTLKRVDDRTFGAQLTLREATTLEIGLTSRKTGLASKPTFLSIGLLKDREPRVTLRAVGVGSHVTPVATVQLNLAATDDFGLGALRLQIERTLNPEDKAEPKAGGGDKVDAKTVRTTVTIPLTQDKDHPVLDYQVQHDVVLQTDPPKVGALLRFVAEADDRCVRGVQTGRSSLLQLQVVSADELFYEILIRQRAERAKFLAVLESLEKQTPVLAGEPKADDFLRVMRLEHTGSRLLDQIAGRIGDTLQEMKLNQIGSPKSHRLLQDGVIDPMRALTAGPMNQLRGVLQTLAGGSSTAVANEGAARRLHAEVVTTMKKILDQMSQWESFVDVVNQVAEVIRMEQKVLQATEKARETRTKDVFDDKP